MRKTDVPIGIHNAVQRHATQFEKVHFLSILHSHRMGRIRQPHKGNMLAAPVLTEYGGWIRPNRQDLSTATGKLLITISKARQLRAAIRSHKPAQERQHNRLATIIRQSDMLPLDIFQFKIRCQIPWRNQPVHSFHCSSLGSSCSRTS